MPIRADLKHFYGPEWRKVIRPRILARAGNRCERCGKPNNQDIRQIVQPGMRCWWFDLVDGQIILRSSEGATLQSPELWPIDEQRAYTVRVILTVAHLDHDSSNMADENLAALCQWCHLHHDEDHHRETRAVRKDTTRPLLFAPSEPPPNTQDGRHALFSQRRPGRLFLKG